MAKVLYFSNFCNNCKDTILKLKDNLIKNEIHFICIDKRYTDNNGDTYISLDNGKQMMLPKIINSVPSLMLLNNGFKVILGKNEILNYLNINLQQDFNKNNTNKSNFNNNLTNSNHEVDSFSLSNFSNCGVSSDSFSFLDQDSNELSAKGNGGLRQMHQYANLGNFDKIETPEDNYQPNKIGNNDNSLEKLKQKRMIDDRRN